jgi:hypothetical protein
MKKISSIIIGFLLLILWGCSKDTVPTESAQTDEQQIQAEILKIEESSTEDYFYSDVDEESENNFYKPLDTFLEKPIIPFRFGRIRLHPLVRDIRIVLTSDTTAEALFHKIMRGSFVSIVGDGSLTDTLQIYRTVRPMGHEFQRIVHFVKRDGLWRMKDFSLALGNSRGVVNTMDDIVTTTLQIVKMTVAVNDDVVEITDPLDFFQTRENVFGFSHGTEVNVTVHVRNDTENPVYSREGTLQTELVRLHHGRHRLHRYHGIKMFKYAGQDEAMNNVYEGSWIISQWLGVHHAVIDVIDNGTIFNDDINVYPYNSTTWSTPYKVILP